MFCKYIQRIYKRYFERQARAAARRARCQETCRCAVQHHPLVLALIHNLYPTQTRGELSVSPRKAPSMRPPPAPVGSALLAPSDSLRDLQTALTDLSGQDAARAAQAAFVVMRLWLAVCWTPAMTLFRAIVSQHNPFKTLCML